MKVNLVRAVVAVSLLATVLAAAGPARASFHLMAVSEVFTGTTDHLNADFVELTMLADGQDEVDGTRLRFYDSDGNLTGTAPLSDDLTNGAAGDTILIASPSAGSLFGVTPDFTMTTSISGLGGKVCFESPPVGDITTVIDCASWGAFHGSSTGSGEPFRSDHQIPLGASMARKGTAPSLIDSDDSKDDFKIDGPAPRTFAGVTGSAPGSVFSLGAGLLELTEGDFPRGIAISRGGSTGDAATVSLVGRTGSASPNDFSVSPADLQFAPNDTLEFAFVQVVDDDRLEPKERFWLVLTNPSDAGQDGSVLDTYVETRVTITDDEIDNSPPGSAIYKPADGRSYAPSQLRTFKGTVVEGENESGVDRVQIALRKNLKNGSCKWLKKSGRFDQAPCSAKRFLSADLLRGKIEWRYRLGSTLAPSVGAKIKNYTLFSRARDKAGNQESVVEDPNRAWFEVTEEPVPE